MKNKKLFLCNTVYQVMVALWLKYSRLADQPVDLIVTDHMNGAEQLRERIAGLDLYENVYFARTLKEARYKAGRTHKENLRANLDPMWLVRQYADLNDRDYSELYIANFDGFSQLLFNGLSRRNPKLELSAFEDGLSTFPASASRTSCSVPMPSVCIILIPPTASAASSPPICVSRPPT